MGGSESVVGIVGNVVVPTFDTIEYSDDELMLLVLLLVPIVLLGVVASLVVDFSVNVSLVGATGVVVIAADIVDGTIFSV